MQDKEPCSIVPALSILGLDPAFVSSVFYPSDVHKIKYLPRRSKLADENIRVLEIFFGQFVLFYLYMYIHHVSKQIYQQNVKASTKKRGIGKRSLYSPVKTPQEHITCQKSRWLLFVDLVSSGCIRVYMFNRNMSSSKGPPSFDNKDTSIWSTKSLAIN